MLGLVAERLESVCCSSLVRMLPEDAHREEKLQDVILSQKSREHARLNMTHLRVEVVVVRMTLFAAQSSGSCSQDSKLEDTSVSHDVMHQN